MPAFDGQNIREKKKNTASGALVVQLCKWARRCVDNASIVHR